MKLLLQCAPTLQRPATHLSFELFRTLALFTERIRAKMKTLQKWKKK